ncbi:STAS domain-containing protein [Streptomyces gibsoniae]|uniref:STAS domain-containing protein n=1 Tax=Streptomyces gibsoniae TaxID=3075529 RepID=A0ABU2TP99_9ACTN|nr:STAS domain-containing protein [Streptomyces sp. DSM 41699]MDT0462772.1 STAS domain-containing protein [Streptomyces sp. DSM 41699]
MGSEDRCGVGVPKLTVSVGRLDGWIVASLAGEIDILTVPRLRAHLGDLVADHGGRPQLIVDLGDVTFCDALGLSALIGAHHTAARRGGTLCVVVPEGRVRRFLRLAKPTHDLKVHDTLSDAVGPV